MTLCEAQMQLIKVFIARGLDYSNAAQCAADLASAAKILSTFEPHTAKQILDAFEDGHNNLAGFRQKGV